MMHHDPIILVSMLEDRDRRIADLENLLSLARQCAIRWEEEAKAVRKELQRMRMSADTERLPKRK